MQYQSLLKVIIYILEPTNNKGKYQKLFLSTSSRDGWQSYVFVFTLSSSTDPNKECLGKDSLGTTWLLVYYILGVGYTNGKGKTAYGPEDPGYYGFS